MDKLEIVLVPCSGNLWLAFPKEIIGQVYPYAPLLEKEENAGEFVAGAMLVQNEKLPVFDFQFEQQALSYDGFYRTVLVSTIQNTKFQHYAIVSYGLPMPISIERDQIKTVSPGTHKYIAQYVTIVGEDKRRIAILDLPTFENNLSL